MGENTLIDFQATKAYGELPLLTIVLKDGPRWKHKPTGKPACLEQRLAVSLLPARSGCIHARKKRLYKQKQTILVTTWLVKSVGFLLALGLLFENNLSGRGVGASMNERTNNVRAAKNHQKCHQGLNFQILASKADHG